MSGRSGRRVFQRVYTVLQVLDARNEVLDEGIERRVNKLVVAEDDDADQIRIGNVGDGRYRLLLGHVLMIQLTAMLRGRVSLPPVD